MLQEDYEITCFLGVWVSVYCQWDPQNLKFSIGFEDRSIRKSSEVRQQIALIYSNSRLTVLSPLDTSFPSLDPHIVTITMVVMSRQDTISSPALDHLAERVTQYPTFLLGQGTKLVDSLKGICKRKEQLLNRLNSIMKN